MATTQTQETRKYAIYTWDGYDPDLVNEIGEDEVYAELAKEDYVSYFVKMTPEERRLSGARWIFNTEVAPALWGGRTLAGHYEDDFAEPGCDFDESFKELRTSLFFCIYDADGKAREREPGLRQALTDAGFVISDFNQADNIDYAQGWFLDEADPEEVAESIRKSLNAHGVEIQGWAVNSCDTPGTTEVYIISATAEEA